jgi:hypothetical protein
MTQAYNLSQLANNLDSTGRLDAADGLVNAVPVANGGTGATSASAARTNLGVASSEFAIPSGGIIMWSGSVGGLPTGWYLCDGSNGTPDLRDRFIIGAGGSYGVGASGGSADAIVVAHTHTGTTSTVGDHAHPSLYNVGACSSASPQGNGAYVEGAVQYTTGAAGAHNHTFTTNSTGQSGTNANLPPYYALAFIMKS